VSTEGPYALLVVDHRKLILNQGGLRSLG
jgi:hypothetical protein